MKKKIVLEILSIGIVSLTILFVGYLFYKKELSNRSLNFVPTKVENQIGTIKISTRVEQNYIFNTNATIEDITLSQEKKNIYLFYGDGCPYCEQEMNFLKELYQEINFNLYAFEVWHNEENREFLEKISQALNTNSNLVPMLVINDKAIIGFSEKTKEEIKAKLSEKPTIDIYEKIYKK